MQSKKDGCCCLSSWCCPSVGRRVAARLEESKGRNGAKGGGSTTAWAVGGHLGRGLARAAIEQDAGANRDQNEYQDYDDDDDDISGGSSKEGKRKNML